MFYYKRIKIYLCGYFEHNRSDLKFLCWRIFVNAGKRILSRKGSVKATPIRIGTVIVPSVKIHFWTDYFITQLDKTPFELPQTGVMCMRSKLGRPVEFPWSLCLHSSNKPRFLWAAKGTLRGDFEFSFASKLKLTLQRKNPSTLFFDCEGHSTLLCAMIVWSITKRTVIFYGELSPALTTCSVCEWSNFRLAPVSKGTIKCRHCC